MRPRIVKYLIYSILCVMASLMTVTEAQAQRARKHRLGINTNDSTEVKQNKDSLNLLEENRRMIDASQKAVNAKLKRLEAPVDTAMLAAQSDSAMAKKTKGKWMPNSQRSLWMAMIIPGAGQIYNRKYWKLPIIYGGFVGCAYALTWNSAMYKDYSQAYQDIMSDNPNNDSYMDFLPPNYDLEANRKHLEDKFRKGKDVYRRQRDLSIFAFIGVYLLSVIDAYVDAELSNFDISKDLGMKLEPTIFNDVQRSKPLGVGLQCSFKF